MDVQKFCTKCLREVAFDTTEHLWACECFATRTIQTDEFDSSLEFVPLHWIETDSIPQMIEMLNSFAFWMHDLLGLARELQKDLKNFYEPIKGWPPHIEALEGLTDYDSVLEGGKAFLEKFNEKVERSA